MFSIQLRVLGSNLCRGCRPMSIIRYRSSDIMQHSRIRPAELLDKCRQPIFFSERTIMMKPKVISTQTPKYKQDGIPAEYQFIYGSGTTNYVQYGVPAIIVVFSCCSVIVMKMLIDHHWYGKIAGKVKIFEQYAELDPLLFTYIWMAFMPCIVFGLHRVVQSLMTRMYYNPISKEYIGIILRYGIMKRKIRFTSKDIEYLGTSGMRGNISVKGYRCLMLESDFTQTVHFNNFMGYKEDRRSDHAAQMEDDHIRTVASRIRQLQSTKINNSFIEKYQEKRKMKQKGK